MAKAFPLLKLIIASTGWEAVRTIFYGRWYDPDSNLRPPHPDSGVLLPIQIYWVLLGLYISYNLITLKVK